MLSGGESALRHDGNCRHVLVILSAAKDLNRSVFNIHRLVDSLNLERDQHMKIGELAHRAGLNASAIRYYEKLGLLAPPHRSGGQRRYSPEALDRVLLIRFAGEMGFSLPEIKLFLNGLRDKAPVGPRWKKLAAKKLSEVEASIARGLRLKALLQNLQHCHCASLKQCVTALGLSENLRFVAGRSR